MIPTKHTLYDDFTYKGKFWLPPQKRRKPRKVDGILTVTAGKRITLELFDDLVKPGPFHDPMGDAGEHGKPPLIWGQTDDGHTLTLFNSFWTNRNWGSAGHTRVQYTSNLCIIGAWFEGEDDVKFHKLELMLTHLEQWLDVDPFHSEAIMDGEEHVGMKLTYHFHKDITVAVPDPKVTFKLVAHLMPESTRNRSVLLEHTSAVELIPAAPLSKSLTFELMGNVQKLFTLMVGEQVFVRTLRGWTKVRDASPRVTKAARKALHDVACDVFFNQFDLREAGDLMSHRMTMPYGAMMPQFPATLLSWFASLPTLGPMYNVFFATYRAGQMFTETRFLHLSQAVESFDRQANGGKKTLRERITRLLEALAKDERDLICTDVAEFTGLVVDTRNNFTHVLGEPAPSAKARILKGDQLRHAAKKLQLLMVILLLKNLGLPSDLILKRVKNCQRFDLELLSVW